MGASVCLCLHVLSLHCLRIRLVDGEVVLISICKVSTTLLGGRTDESRLPGMSVQATGNQQHSLNIGVRRADLTWPWLWLLISPPSLGALPLALGLLSLSPSSKPCSSQLVDVFDPLHVVERIDLAAFIIGPSLRGERGFVDIRGMIRPVLVLIAGILQCQLSVRCS